MKTTEKKKQTLDSLEMNNSKSLYRVQRHLSSNQPEQNGFTKNSEHSAVT